MRRPSCRAVVVSSGSVPFGSVPGSRIVRGPRTAPLPRPRPGSRSRSRSRSRSGSHPRTAPGRGTGREATARPAAGNRRFCGMPVRWTPRRRLPRMARCRQDPIHRHGPGRHPHRRRARAQPEERVAHAAPEPSGRVHRPERLRQVLPRLRHDLRRGPAQVRRIPLRLRPPVPRPAAAARRRFHRRPVPRHRHRAAHLRLEPPLDHRHHDRDLRLPPAPLRPRRPAPLPRYRRTHPPPDHQRPHRPPPRPPPPHPRHPPRPGRRRPERRVPRRPRTPRTRRFRPGADRRHAGGTGGRQPAAARPQTDPRHRGGGRPPGGRRPDPGPFERFGGDGAEMGRRPPGHPASAAQQPDPRPLGRRGAFQPQLQPRHRPELRRPHPQAFLLQFTPGRLPGLPGTRPEDGLRRRPDRAGRHQVPRRRRGPCPGGAAASG
jgi:hypothetical protein